MIHLNTKPSNSIQTGQLATKVQYLPYGRRLVKSYTDFRGKIAEDVAVHLARIEPIVAESMKSAKMGAYPKEEAYARAFYTGMIRPFLLKGTLHRESNVKTFAPNRTYVDTFSAAMSRKRVNTQMYVRLLQSRPGIGQTDTRVSYSALEVLRTWAVRVRVADELGLQYTVTIIDETSAFEPGWLLGFTPKAIEESHNAMQIFIDACEVPKDSFRVVHFSNQARFYRGEAPLSVELSREYNALLAKNVAQTLQDIIEKRLSLQAVRAVMLHRLRYGEAFINVSGNRDLEYLASFESQDVAKTIELSESFHTALQMRTATREYAAANGIETGFPEFFTSAAYYWGITKKSDRLSIQPNFKSYNGRLAAPGYALPVYSQHSHDFLGLTSYTAHTNASYLVIPGPNGLPAALIEQGSRCE